MIRIGPVSIALLGGIVLGVFLPYAAQAACSRWDVSGEWSFIQTNDTIANFILQQTETGLQGTGQHVYYNESIEKYTTAHASVDGTIEGNSFEITAYWDNGTTGVYTGKVGPGGRIVGSGYDKQHPQTMANWYSDRTAKCLTSAGGTSAGGVSPSSVTPPVDATTPPPVKPAGRVKVPSNLQETSTLTKCQRAWQARARTSPAAPGLEDLCQHQLPPRA